MLFDLVIFLLGNDRAKPPSLPLVEVWTEIYTGCFQMTRVLQTGRLWFFFFCKYLFIILGTEVTILDDEKGRKTAHAEEVSDNNDGHESVKYKEVSSFSTKRKRES